MNTSLVFFVLLFEILVLISSIYLFFIYIRHQHLRYAEVMQAPVALVLVGVILIFTSIAGKLLTLFGVPLFGYIDPPTYTVENWGDLNWEAIGWINICIGVICIVGGLTRVLTSSIYLDNAAQNSLKISAENEVFFEESPIPLIIINNKLRIIKTNPALCHLINQAAQLIERKPLRKVIHHDDQDNLKTLDFNLFTADQSKDLSIELRLISDTQQETWMQVTPRIIRTDDNKNYMLLWLYDINPSKRLNQLIEFHSNYDPLTRFRNREVLENYLANAYKNNSKSIILIYIDIDQLKVVNDTCGRGAGDILLQNIANIIQRAGKNCNLFARMGGDEFAIAKLGGTLEEAKQIAERMRSAAEDFNFTWNNQKYRQSISVGVAISSNTINCVVDLVGAADSACYAAKNKGKNRVVVYSDDLESSQDSRRDMMWVSRLQKAVQDGSFVLYFQPIKRLNGDPYHIHYEFLIRYKDESGEHILPQHFIPAVERFGLSEQVDLWVLTTALDYLDKHPEHTRTLNCCSINLTSQSIANPRIRSAILQVVASYNFPLEKICFEITESSAIHNIDEAREFIQELKTLGCHLALDDFGTGFSSFAYLKNLEVDYLKIDGSFVRDIIDDKFDRAMVSSINNIGKEIGISIIAEYAHSDNILTLLEEMNVDYAQGHAIAKPMPLTMLQTYYH